jgi:hypothetical protein
VYLHLGAWSPFQGSTGGRLLARLPLGTVGGWVDPLLAPGASRVPRCDPGGTAALGATWGGGAYRTLCPWWRGSGRTAEPGPRSGFWAVPRTPARASVPVLEPGSDDRAEAGYQCSHDDAQRADLQTGRWWRSRQAPRDCQRGPLLTDCSQTVRIQLDVPAHVGGKDAGQAHNDGHVCTSWDRLVGFKSRHYWGQGGERLV